MNYMMLRYRYTGNFLSKKKCEEKHICMEAMLNIEVSHEVAYVTLLFNLAFKALQKFEKYSPAQFTV